MFNIQTKKVEMETGFGDQTAVDTDDDVYGSSYNQWFRTLCVGNPNK